MFQVKKIQDSQEINNLSENVSGDKDPRQSGN